MDENEKTINETNDKSNEKKSVPGFLKSVIIEYKVLFIIMLTIIIVYNVTFRVFLQMVTVPSESMENTIQVGDHAIGVRNADIERQDIIIFWCESEQSVYIKRVIGIPGDKVEITPDSVIVNGAKLDEPYLKEKIDDDDPLVCELAENEYFVMGDNRYGSIDSREFGPVKESDIQSKVIKIY